MSFGNLSKHPLQAADEVVAKAALIPQYAQQDYKADTVQATDTQSFAETESCFEAAQQAFAQ